MIWIASKRLSQTKGEREGKLSRRKSLLTIIASFSQCFPVYKCFLVRSNLIISVAKKLVLTLLCR